MNPADRIALSAKLVEACRLIAELNDSLHRDLEPRLLVGDADQLHDRAADVLALVVTLARQPGELPFTGGNVLVDEAKAAGDRDSNRAMGERHNERADQLEKGAA